VADHGDGILLRRVLGLTEVTAGGVGMIIGAGIYVLLGAATQEAGSLVWLSFVIAAALAGLTGLSYAELSSMFPSAAGEYEYTRHALPDWVAFAVGWTMIVGLVVTAAAVSMGFARYLQYFVAVDVRVAAVGLLVILAGVATVGIRQSARLTVGLSAIQVGGLLMVVVIGLPHLGEVDVLAGPGARGVLGAAALVFFAFIGFDVVATTAEEARDPQRDMPRGILGSLAIVTVLYMAVSLVITGMQNYTEIDPEDAAPLATAFNAVGLEWMGRLISIGACIGLIVVVMILMLGQTRVGFAMARDGLLPRGLSKVHPKFGTPYIFTAITGVAVALIGGLVDLTILVNLVSIGTLFAFLLVSVGVAILRRTRPDLPRSFRVPAVNVVAGLSVLMCLWLMLNLTGETWIRFVIWMLIGFVVYFAYGRRRSRLALRSEEERPA